MQRLLVFAALAILAATSFARDGQWARANCSGGHFSVLLPEPFHESTGDNVDIGGVRVATGAKNAFYIGGTPTPGINFFAAKLIFASVADARNAVPHFSLAEPPGYQRVYIRRGDVAGLPGTDSKSLSPQFVGYRRVLLSGETVFLLTVEAPAEKDKEVEPQVKKFFESLALERK
jgi:hypothetical protein